MATTFSTLKSKISGDTSSKNMSSPTNAGDKLASVVKQTVGQSTAIGAGSGLSSTPTSSLTKTQVSGSSSSSSSRSSGSSSSRSSTPTPTPQSLSISQPMSKVPEVRPIQPQPTKIFNLKSTAEKQREANKKLEIQRRLFEIQKRSQENRTKLQNINTNRQINSIIQSSLDKGFLSKREEQTLKEIGVSRPQEKFKILQETKIRSSEKDFGKLDPRLQTTLQRKASQLGKKATQDTLKQINKQLNSIETRSLNRLSATPKEIRDYEQQVKRLNAIALKQEIPRLKNSLKQIGVGAYEFGKETILIPIDLVRGSYNYGYKLSQRSNQAGQSVIKTLGRDLKQGGSTVADVTKFVAKNPVKSLVIAGAIGKTGLNSFMQNPEKNTTKLLLTIFSGKIIAKGLTSLKSLSKVKNVNNSFNFTQKGVGGKSKLTGSLRGLDANGKKFTGVYKLRITDKGMTGSINYKLSNGKKITEQLNLIDKGSFYLDTKTGRKFAKTVEQLQEIRTKTKITEISATGKSGTLLTSAGNVRYNDAEVSSRLIKTLISLDRKTKKTTTTVRTGILRFYERLDNIKKNKKFNESLQLTKKTLNTYSKKPKSLDSKQIFNLNKFLKSIDYDNKILSGLDKTRLIARALGVSQTQAKKYNQILKTIRTQIKQAKGITRVKTGAPISKTRILKTTKISAKGGFVKPTKEIYNLKWQKTATPKTRIRRVRLIKNKKGSVAIPQQTQVLKAKTLKGQTIRTRIEIPILTPQIYGRVFKISGKSLSALLSLTQIRNKFKQLDLLKSKIKNQFKLKNIDVQKTQNLISQQNKIIQDIAQITILKTTQTTKQVQKTAQITKSLTKKSSPTPRVPSLKIKPTIPNKPLNLPRLKLGWNSPKLDNRLVLYEARYRERRNPRLPAGPRNPVVVKRLRKLTTRNRMTQIVAKLTDNRTIRSIAVQPLKITKKKQKDIKRPSILRKFEKPKTKKGLQLVEKSKYTIDSPGEKAELRRSKARKKTLSRPRPRKKVKTIKRKSIKR
jgi:hypothetical protein